MYVCVCVQCALLIDEIICALIHFKDQIQFQLKTVFAVSVVLAIWNGKSVRLPTNTNFNKTRFFIIESPHYSYILFLLFFLLVFFLFSPFEGNLLQCTSIHNAFSRLNDLLTTNSTCHEYLMLMANIVWLLVHHSLDSICQSKSVWIVLLKWIIHYILWCWDWLYIERLQHIYLSNVRKIWSVVDAWCTPFHFCKGNHRNKICREK